ncbi:hypothetical protein RFI_06495 [Reticulomyxa filosa]|uniref:Neurotransmitter-gated ion-channel ligand-binding domain-containing protein n=1 Tax=Reticulomyxa filosa TaxID=46433 RepID=X6NXS1_RETFI|nr:hypothetical protein RFI_06495 [Reticulomyxa filosa]|eukprot:ETO30624.1 hypothetical protein RFI_06495 [Reticulomyxa filosa]
MGRISRRRYDFIVLFLKKKKKVKDKNKHPLNSMFLINNKQKGKFRLSKFKDFGKLLCDDDSPAFDPTKAYFIRGKFDVEMLLAEELELHAFPFDVSYCSEKTKKKKRGKRKNIYIYCQDLGVVMRESSTDVKITFLPELRRKHFGSVDPRYSVIDEWDMEAARIELGQTNAGSSRSSTTYPMIILRLKMKRRWGSTMWNVCFLMSCIEMLALSSFSIDPVLDPGDRLGLGFTLVLTAVAFLFVVKKGLPPDKYILSGNLFLISTNLETAFLATLNVDNYNYVDTVFLWGCLTYLIVYHILFVWYAVTLRGRETTKLIMDSDEIENENLIIDILKDKEKIEGYWPFERSKKLMSIKAHKEIFGRCKKQKKMIMTILYLFALL